MLIHEVLLTPFIYMFFTLSFYSGFTVTFPFSCACQVCILKEGDSMIKADIASPGVKFA